jgi:hypothetical protein
MGVYLENEGRRGREGVSVAGRSPGEKDFHPTLVRIRSWCLTRFKAQRYLLFVSDDRTWACPKITLLNVVPIAL